MVGSVAPCLGMHGAADSLLTLRCTTIWFRSASGTLYWFAPGLDRHP